MFWAGKTEVWSRRKPAFRGVPSHSMESWEVHSGTILLPVRPEPQPAILTIASAYAALVLGATGESGKFFQVTLLQVEDLQWDAKGAVLSTALNSGSSLAPSSRPACGMLTIDTSTRASARAGFALCLFLEAEERMCWCFPRGGKAPALIGPVW